MTKEEAGQRILEGNVWKKCQACQGGGAGKAQQCAIELLTNGMVVIEPRVVVPACQFCDGYGELEDCYHAMARIRLGLKKSVSKKNQYKMRIMIREERLLRIIESPARFGIDEVIVQHRHRGMWAAYTLKPTNKNGGWEPEPHYRLLEMR